MLPCQNMKKTKCIDVESRFPTYRCGYEDDSFQATRDPWHKIVMCRHGHVCPAGGTKLWACTKAARGKAAKQLREHGLRVVADGDDGINVEFDVTDYKTVFEIMGAISK